MITFASVLKKLLNDIFKKGGGQLPIKSEFYSAYTVNPGYYHSL